MMLFGPCRSRSLGAHNLALANPRNCAATYASAATATPSYDTSRLMDRRRLATSGRQAVHRHGPIDLTVMPPDERAACPDIGHRDLAPACARDSDRVGASCSGGRCGKSAFTVGRKREAGPNVVTRYVWKVLQDVVFRHAASEIFEDVIDRDAKTANAWLAAPLSRLDRNDLPVIHTTNGTR